MGENKVAPKKPSLTSTPLWYHQRQAVNTVRKYLAAFTQNQTTGASLVHMPTGTGKTGVIGCVSHFLRNAGCVLVLCPRIALRDQLAREVSGRFFTKLGLTDNLPKTVRNIAHGYPMISDDEYARTILVMTIQMLHSMKNRGNENYTALRSRVNLVIVDEGHYEPALSWRDAIRGLEAPKVIFTATPFRNDLKLFDIDYDHAFSYTFQRAVEDKTIRRVEIHPRPEMISPQSFMNDVVGFYDTQFPNAQHVADPPRMIIRCDSQATIRQIGTALENAGRSYVLIHEIFIDDQHAPHERRSVPNPDEEDAVFWVHQFKLLEGIDDPRFQLLAIYEELKTTRALVQQIGRVLRNPTRQANAIGHVLDHSNGRQQELWEGFLGFDKLIGRVGVQVADFGMKMLAEIEKAQPDVVYIDGRFRTSFTLDQIDPNDELVLPATVNVFRKSDDFDLGDLCDEIRNEYDQQDRNVRQAPIGGTEVFLYLTFRNSPLLRSKCFIECRFGVTILREVGDYLCYFDSGGSVPVLLDDHVEPVPVSELRRLFRKANRTYLTSVSLRNSNLGHRVIRARAISASRIEDTLPTFDDHSFVCRTAQGYSQVNGGVVRRYVGFSRGKITDSSAGRIMFDEYLEWLDTITEVLESGSDSIGSFARFAAYADIPAQPEPLNVLLDVGEVQELFFTNEFNGVMADEPMQIENACCEVNGGSFSLMANGKQCNATIAFIPKTGRYRIDSPDLETLYYSNEEGLNRGLVRYLNHEQSFRVIPASHGSFYTLGEFYSPILRFGKRYDDDQIGLLKVIHPANCLAHIGSEKGTACAADKSGWDQQSLFSIIDSLGVGHELDGLFGTPDIVVCDDMGTEAADFILADVAMRRVVFIHAKGNTGKAHLYAASPLQEVCGQATKNLKYFSRYGNDRPPKAVKWHHQKWSAKGVTGQVTKRIRRCPPGTNTGLKVWQQIQSIIRDPFAELQVWLFLGRLLSKNEFESQVTSKNPAPEAKQAAYLLFSTMNDIASVGARIKVVCSP